MHCNAVHSKCPRCCPDAGVVRFPSKQAPSVPHFSLGKIKEGEEKESPISHYLELGIMSVYLDIVTQIM